MAEEINMAVCQPAGVGLGSVKSALSAKHITRNQRTDSLKEKMQMALHKGHTLVITTYFMHLSHQRSFSPTID